MTHRNRTHSIMAWIVMIAVAAAGRGGTSAAQGLNGTELWVTRLNGPVSGPDGASAIAVDASGNSYVTGYICTAFLFGDGCAFNWETVKYDTNGNTLWTAKVAGDGEIFDFPSAIAVDASGNVYVTGAICTWASCDELGSCYPYRSDIATVKYDPNGQQLWMARYNGGGSGGGYAPDSAAAVAVDSSGNVYVTGTSYGAESLDTPHYVTLKYDSNGNRVWAARYVGPGNGTDAASAIGLDTSGNVYVTGASTGTLTSFDYATVKYDNAGNRLWVARYDGPQSGDDVAVALAVSGNGNLYVTGRSIGTGTANDYATIKYDSAGNQLWLARYDGPAHGTDYATGLAVGSDKSVYVTGVSSGTNTSQFATLKYDSNGNQMWVARYESPGNWAGAPVLIALDQRGRVIVTGSSRGVGTGSDYATIQYSPDGATNWVDRYDGPGFDNIPYGLAVDPDGNVYVTGPSFDSVTQFDWATLKLAGDPSGSITPP